MFMISKKLSNVGLASHSHKVLSVTSKLNSILDEFGRVIEKVVNVFL